MGKEKYEWVRCWCDNANKYDLPRILLVGDSITEGYQEFVRKAFEDIIYVDYFATSYAVNTKIYHELLGSFIRDSRYDLIHFNNGLHGFDMGKKEYKKGVKNAAKRFYCENIILATSTVVYEKGNTEIDREWERKIEERNLAIHEIAHSKAFFIDDLYKVSLEIAKEDRAEDGTHYLEAGSEKLAESVVKSIKDAIY